MNTEYTVIIPFICFIYMLYVCFITRCKFALSHAVSLLYHTLCVCFITRCKFALSHAVCLLYHTLYVCKPLAVHLHSPGIPSPQHLNMHATTPRSTQTHAVTHHGPGFVYLTMLIFEWLKQMQWHTQAFDWITSRCSFLNDSNRCSDTPRRLIGLPHSAHLWMTQTDAVTYSGVWLDYLTVLIFEWLKQMQWHTQAINWITSQCSSLNDSNRCSDTPRRWFCLPHDAHLRQWWHWSPPGLRRHCYPEAAPYNPEGIRGQAQKGKKAFVGVKFEKDGAMQPRGCSM